MKTSSFLLLSILDAAKRKNLPAWIREGLEKMERDKRKKKEEEERQKRQIERKRPLWAEEDENEGSQDDDGVHENGLGGGDAKGTKLQESDEELPDDEEAIKEAEAVEEERGGDTQPSRTLVATPPPIFLTPEEKEQQFALNVKRFMTEILVAVLTEELDSVAGDEIRRARERVTAKPKKVTSALANIVGIGKLKSIGVNCQVTGQRSLIGFVIWPVRWIFGLGRVGQRGAQRH